MSKTFYDKDGNVLGEFYTKSEIDNRQPTLKATITATGDSESSNYRFNHTTTLNVNKIYGIKIKVNNSIAVSGIALPISETYLNFPVVDGLGDGIYQCMIDIGSSGSLTFFDPTLNPQCIYDFSATIIIEIYEY